MSERVEEQLVELLQHPRVDPYGNPIPGLEEIGESAAVAAQASRTLASVVTAEEVQYTLARIGEPLQVDVDLLTTFENAGVVPGATLQAHRDADEVTVAIGGQSMAISDDVAAHLFVE